GLFCCFLSLAPPPLPCPGAENEAHEVPTVCQEGQARTAAPAGPPPPSVPRPPARSASAAPAGAESGGTVPPTARRGALERPGGAALAAPAGLDPRGAAARRGRAADRRRRRARPGELLPPADIRPARARTGRRDRPFGLPCPGGRARGVRPRPRRAHGETRLRQTARSRRHRTGPAGGLLRRSLPLARARSARGGKLA